MSLYLDSAFPEIAQTAFSWGFVQGITTNPTLLHRVQRPAQEVFQELCDVAAGGTVFYQLNAPTLEERREEGKRILAQNPKQIGLKIPCTLENLALATEFVKQGYTVGITAIFSPAQAFLACQAGAHYVLPYVNRSTRLLGDGLNLVSEMREVIEASGVYTQILAASIKTPAEAAATVQAGAHHLTLPLEVIRDMAQHHLSDQAIADFGN